MHLAPHGPGSRGPLTARRAGLITLAILIVLMMIIPPANATTVERTSERVHLAGGAWLTETENASSDLTVRGYNQVDQSTSGGTVKYKDPLVTLFYTHKESVPGTNLVLRTEYEGFQALEGSTFEFDLSLGRTNAHLEVPLYGYRCLEEDNGPAGISPGECEELPALTVTVDLTWEGHGAIDRSTSHESILDIPGFTFQSHTLQISRNAVLTGTVSGGGIVLADGPTDIGLLLIGSYRERTTTG